MIKLKIIVPVYNSEKWIQKCIRSILHQNYKNWEAIVIDDASTDKTSQKILKFEDSKIIYKRNSKRKRALENIIEGIKLLNCIDEDVIVIVDGDDWLPDTEVFKKLDKVYQNPKIWLTYGSYEIHPHDRISDKTRPATIHDNPRKGPMIYRHLRTFKYFLWKNLKDESFRHTLTGEYYPSSYDVAIMRPLVELAGLEHIRHISNKMYVYNFINPIRDGKVNRVSQMKCGEDVALRQSPYKSMSKKELVKCIRPSL